MYEVEELDSEKLLFPIDSWNVHFRTESDMRYIDNHLERYHETLQSLITFTDLNL